MPLRAQDYRESDPRVPFAQVVYQRRRVALFAKSFSNYRQESGIVHRLLQESLCTRLERPVPIWDATRPETTVTGIVDRPSFPFNLSTALKPSPAGKPKSGMIRSGMCFRASAILALHPPQRQRRKLFPLRHTWRLSLTSGSSSIIRILLDSCLLPVFQQTLFVDEILNSNSHPSHEGLRRFVCAS
jgi:hypothetical protein